MNEQPVLSVRGEALVEVEPEIASIGLSITARDSDRAKTLRLLNERAATVDDLLRRFGDAIEKTETSGVRISPQLKSRRPQERVAGFVGVVHHTITVADFDRLGELVAQLANLDMADVAGPWWALRPDSPVHRRVRVAAVEDAVQRARDYAQAIGGELSALVELADSRLLSDSRGRGAGDAVFAASAAPRAMVGAPEEFTFDIAPAKQLVRATVEARFRITSPDLSAIPPRPGPG